MVALVVGTAPVLGDTGAATVVVPGVAQLLLSITSADARCDHAVPASRLSQPSLRQWQRVPARKEPPPRLPLRRWNREHWNSPHRAAGPWSRCLLSQL